MLEYIGDLELGEKVDITDPCYGKDVFCRMTIACKPGLYKGYAETYDEGKWGKRVASISIFYDKIQEVGEMECIGRIGVDSGLAGFFNNKPDFSDDEWSEFCDKLKDGYAWCFCNGIFSSSGFGDGIYDVYTNKEHNAFVIVFFD